MAKVFFSVILSFLSVFFSIGQDTLPNLTKKQKKSFLLNDKNWAVEIPIWIPGFFGEYVYGDVLLEGEDGEFPTPENPIEPGWQPGDILSRVFDTEGHLNFFFLSKVSYTNEKFTSQFDAFSGSVGGALVFNYNDKELVSAKINTTLMRAYIGYRIYQNKANLNKFKYNAYAYGGTRIHSVKVRSDLNNLINRIDISPLWAEPILGVYNEIKLDRWMFIAQADVGSFYINERLSYMINVYAYYRVGKILSLKIGWCDWDIDYKDRYLGEDLILNMHLSGPSAAVTFHF